VLPEVLEESPSASVDEVEPTSVPSSVDAAASEVL
jgi:hypothetical protein